MARPNKDVAALLQEYAELVRITGGDAFKARAYEKAARSVSGHPADLSTLDATALREIPNVGRSIADKIETCRATGTMPELEKARGQIPDGVRRLMSVPALGPKKALTLYETLGVSSVPELREAIEAGRLRDLKGFGVRTEQNILHGIDILQAATGRIGLGEATDTAEAVVEELSALPGCARCTWAGSLRRMRESVGDIDVLVASRRSAPFMDALTGLPYVADVIAHGTTKTSVRTVDGVQIDLRVVPPGSWGAALIYFTGSRAHNIRIRDRAHRRGLKLSEYGLFRTGSGRRTAARTEEEVYARLDLPWMPPPLREDRGEIEAALAGELPALVTSADLRGDLHTHTDLTDGLAPLEDMVDAAARVGLEYYAVTDHAPDLVMQGMTDEKALAQRDRLRELDGHRGMRLLHGTELNIGPDGGVDWPPDFLRGFDVCVASVHSHFQQGPEAATRRLVTACENPHIHILGHPTTRILGKRGPLDADLDAVFAACARTGTILEINAHPHRLDLGDENILRARRHGVKFAVDTDAHSVPDLDNRRFGVGTAQRGWLTADDIVNTWPLARLLRHLHSR
ncbi:DNA polymerase/3'-5' exonuclease PolX [Streptomyces sp. TR06-5]|uniref:DNA polymerase/3'-5' exonuclease PolX n=1 Tax=Streptomyces sp. TR06-5 TaxID=3385976 RepID=UPI0039A0D237